MITPHEEHALEQKRTWGPTPAWFRFGKIFWGTFFNTLFSYEVRGAENVPPTGPVLLLANHTSYLDPMLVGTGCPRPLAILGKAELFDNKFVAFFITRWGTYPLHRERADASAVRIAMRVIRDNQALCIFPEGTRSYTGEMQEVKPGTAKLALRLHVPIVPVGISGGFSTFGRNRKYPNFRKKLIVTFGEPFELDQNTASTPENLEQVANTIREKILKLIMYQ